MADQRPDLILATTSSKEKHAFEKLRIPFEGVESGVDESTYRTDDPDSLTAELSKRKARAVAEKHRKKTVVAIHTVGHHRRDILEAPMTKEHARLKLQELSGETHEVLTGITVIREGIEKTEVVTTTVAFRELSDEEIDAYLEEDKQAVKRTLGYDPLKHRSATFIKSIEGSPHNLLSSMPLETVKEMLGAAEETKLQKGSK